MLQDSLPSLLQLSFVSLLVFLFVDRNVGLAETSVSTLQDTLLLHSCHLSSHVIFTGTLALAHDCAEKHCARAHSIIAASSPHVPRSKHMTDDFFTGGIMRGWRPDLIIPNLHAFVRNA